MRVSVDTRPGMALGGGSLRLRKANAAENEVATSLGTEAAGGAAAVDMTLLVIFFANFLSFLAKRFRLNLRVSLVFAIFAGVVESDRLMVGEKLPRRSLQCSAR
jgi:phosphate starvation-inducible membrane PsiE